MDAFLEFLGSKGIYFLIGYQGGDIDSIADILIDFSRSREPKSCCFYVCELFQELFNFSTEQLNQIIKLRSGHELTKYLSNNCIASLNLIDHGIVAIYDTDDRILVIDYYEEADREFPFRVKATTLNELIELIDSIYAGDEEYWWNFFDCSPKVRTGPTRIDPPQDFISLVVSKYENVPSILELKQFMIDNFPRLMIKAVEDFPWSTYNKLGWYEYQRQFIESRNQIMSLCFDDPDNSVS
jgi:hypothetical protein